MARKAKSNRTKQGNTGALPAPQSEAVRQAGDLSACGHAQAGQPSGNAQFSLPHGTAGFVLANGSLTSNSSGEGDIRKAIIEADMVDCIIALPGQLFYTTPIPACLWFLTRKSQRKKIFGRIFLTFMF